MFISKHFRTRIKLSLENSSKYLWASVRSFVTADIPPIVCVAPARGNLFLSKTKTKPMSHDTLLSLPRFDFPRAHLRPSCKSHLPLREFQSVPSCTVYTHIEKLCSGTQNEKLAFKEERKENNSSGTLPFGH